MKSWNSTPEQNFKYGWLGLASILIVGGVLGMFMYFAVAPLALITLGVMMLVMYWMSWVREHSHSITNGQLLAAPINPVSSNELPLTQPQNENTQV